MVTAEQIKKLIREQLEVTQKRKAEIWDRSMLPDADPEDVFFRHALIGECSAYESLLELIEGM